jgi:hypothetical protein
LLCAAHTHILAPKERKLYPFDHDVGASMSVLETVIVALILVWAPALMLGAYLIWGGPRRTID